MVFAAQLGPSVPGLTASLRSEFSVGTGDDRYLDSPVVYQLSWSKLDGFFNGFTNAVRDSELATVRPTFRAGSAQTVAAWSASPMSPRVGIDIVQPYAYTNLPATPTIRMTVADEFRWQPSVAYRTGSTRTDVFIKSAVTCRPGQTCAST